MFSDNDRDAYDRAAEMCPQWFPGEEWWVECKYSGKGMDCAGTFADACTVAQQQCSTGHSCWCVYEVPNNAMVAQVTLRGVEWRAKKYRD